MSLCLTGAAITVALAWNAFTLSWTHSVEKIAWEEDWRVTPSGLALIEARVKGTGAGMEPPAGATLAGGWWHYRPPLAPLPSLTLARSGVVADWRLCGPGGSPDGGCTALGVLLKGADAPVVTLAPCAP